MLLEYPAEWTATFEATLAPGIKGAGVEMCGTEGRLLITRAQFEFTPAEKGAHHFHARELPRAEPRRQLGQRGFVQLAHARLTR